jgi:uncharacterized protein YcfJ
VALGAGERLSAHRSDTLVIASNPCRHTHLYAVTMPDNPSDVHAVVVKSQLCERHGSNVGERDGTVVGQPVDGARLGAGVGMGVGRAAGAIVGAERGSHRVCTP